MEFTKGFALAGGGLLNSNKGNLRCLLSLNFIVEVCQTDLKESLSWCWDNSKRYKYLPLNKHDYPFLYRTLNADAMIRMIVGIQDTRVGGKYVQIEADPKNMIVSGNAAGSPNKRWYLIDKKPRTFFSSSAGFIFHRIQGIHFIQKEKNLRIKITWNKGLVDWNVFHSDLSNILKNLSSKPEFVYFHLLLALIHVNHFPTLSTAKDSPGAVISCGFIWAGWLLDTLAQIHDIQDRLELVWQPGENVLTDSCLGLLSLAQIRATQGPLCLTRKTPEIQSDKGWVSYRELKWVKWQKDAIVNYWLTLVHSGWLQVMQLWEGRNGHIACNHQAVSLEHRALSCFP